MSIVPAHRRIAQDRKKLAFKGEKYNLGKTSIKAHCAELCLNVGF